MPPILERFAPSPTGPLHLGHAYSALIMKRAVKKSGGELLLRIEDLDQTRAREEYVQSIIDDLSWLGLSWQEPILHQSMRFDAYQSAIDELGKRNFIYPCFCSRKQINAHLNAPQEGAVGPDGAPYPGICRNLAANERAARKDAPHILRLDMRKAIASLGGAGIVKKLSFKELGAGPSGERGKINLDPEALIHACGDIALARRDAPASYHLAVTLDDAFQQVTNVTRGRDLFEATKIHRLLQALFGRPTPLYRHHALVRDDQGRRLAKRDKDKALSALRAEGATPEDIWRMAEAAAH